MQVQFTKVGIISVMKDTGLDTNTSLLDTYIHTNVSA